MITEKLIGSKFNGIFRCVDMLCFNLGRDVKDKNGDFVPEFSLHIQTQWRFTKDDKILLASRDIYLPYNTEIDESEWKFDTTGRADDESSIFDVIQKSFHTHFLNAAVSSARVSHIGDLRIAFSNGIVFETFTPSMRKDEFWRLICLGENREDEHFVVFE